MDLIERQQALDILENYSNDVLEVQHGSYAKARRKMCELSSVQPEPQWIPCSERLPERDKDVLVTRDYDGREDNNKSCRYGEVASCYGEDDDIACNACGNPAYPNCKTSCSLFDD